MFLKVGHSIVFGFFALKTLYSNELYSLVKINAVLVVLFCIKKHFFA